MHINKLPDIVIARIFHWACNDPIYRPTTHERIESWRAKLVLLAVCRIWRELALPSVHRVSLIICNPIRPKKNGINARYYIAGSESSDEGYSDLDGSDSESSDELDDVKDETYVVMSSLDIISNTGNKFWPRTIHIFINTSNNPIYSLHHVIEKLRSHTTMLKKVRRLDLFYRRLPIMIPRINESINIAEASSIGEEFSQLMPHVQYIKFWNHVTSDTIVNFSQSLVKGYARQLAGFKCPQYALEKVQSFSDKLRYIDIDRKRNTPYMPQICANNLTKLTLNYVDRYFNWSSFKSNGRSRSLHFPNLKWLRLDVASEDNNVDVVTNEAGYLAHEFNYKVIAPKLDTVILQLCSLTLSFLASIYGLATIPNAELELYRAQICFTELDLGIARDKLESHAKNNLDDFQTIDNYAYMNDMFNIYGLAKSSKAEILFKDVPFDSERIDWKYLLNVEIYCSFHINGLRTLVSKAPSLETIYVCGIEIKENGKLIPEIRNVATNISPMNSSLKLISFEYIIGCTKSERGRFLVYLKKLAPGVTVYLK